MPDHTIAENLARLQAAKTAIGNAIVAKGGTVNSGDGLEEYPADITSIETANLTSISITENGVYSSSDAEEVESSTLPIVIEADGTPLLDFLISGNMSQSGTPTPSSPIQPSECGDRTEQLWDGTVENLGLNTTNGAIMSANNRYAICIPIKENTTYTITRTVGESTYFYYGLTDTKPDVGVVCSSFATIGATATQGTITNTNNKYLIFFFGGGMSTNIMLNEGSTALPYEPYGYKIPISSANTTTPVYLGEVQTTRKIRKLVLTGSETDWSNTYGETLFRLPILNAGGLIGGISSHFSFNPIQSGLNAGLASGEFATQILRLQIVLFFKNTAYTSVSMWKNYLQQQYAAGTPVTVWYILAEPETAVVNEPLRKIGDYADTLSMEQAGVDIPTNTSPSTTTIDIPTTLSPSLLYVKYNTLSTTSGYNIVDVNVPNTYSSSDEGKVVSNRQLIPQIAKPDTIIANNTYDTTNYNSVTVDVENSYTASDEGKVVDNGALVSQTAKPTEITVNDTYDTTMYNSVTVDVANTYTVEDEGKVVSNGALVAQTAKPTAITTNDTYDTTNYNSVTVDVPNTYTQSDEGKVVSNGELVAQTAKPDAVVKNGVYNTTLYNSVNVNVLPEPQERKDVNFYDYDDTIIKRYTTAEFANISELPTNPSHAGLTAQGWNWSLADAKAYVASYGKLNIGQMYITSDDKTRIYISLPEVRTSPILQLYLNANSELDIDWGDGGAHSTFTTTSAKYKGERHNYATSGDYVIAITVVSGGFVLQSSSTTVSSILWNENNNASSPDRLYNNAIKKIEIGDGVTSIGGYAFYECYSLQYITIPDGVTSIDQYAFSGCYSLQSITIPDGVTSIDQYAFSGCYSLSSITIPDSVTSIGSNAFSNCHSLSSITIPDNVTSIGNNVFSNCYSLQSIAIPDNVTSIGRSAFYGCYSLQSITIPDSVTSIAGGTFQNCCSLQSIAIPDNVTSIGNNVFSSCYSLSSITIPDSVTSISDYAFYGCCSLQSIAIPDNVTSIGRSAFQNCSHMSYIKFESTTPPTVSNSNAWSSVPTSCIIYVPTGTLNAYKTATNYPNPSTYTYVEY